MRIKTEKILVTTDFSDNAIAGLSLAASMAQTFGAGLCLLNVVSKDESDKIVNSIEPRMPLDILAARRKERLNRYFEEAIAEEDRKGIIVHPIVRFGIAWEEICKLAEDIGADVVVMATHGRTGLAHLMSGSVTEKVVRKSSRPVLTVRSRKEVVERLVSAKAS
jgi:nucleotide-binding universal stress UspA family protein